MLLMENEPEIDTEEVRKARRLMCQEAVFLTLREALAIGEQKLASFMLNGLKSYEKRILLDNPDKGRRVLRRHNLELKAYLKTSRFRKLVHGMGWRPQDAAALILANLQGERLEETRQIINKVLPDKGRVYGTTGQGARKAKRQRDRGSDA